MKYSIGDVCYVYEGTKERPVVIINNGLGIDIDVSFARVTTKKPRNEFDGLLDKWKEAGLERPSLVRCSKVNTITPGDELVKIGALQHSDLIAVMDGVKLYFERGFETVHQTLRK